jgi:TonB-dependent receptor
LFHGLHRSVQTLVRLTAVLMAAAVAVDAADDGKRRFDVPAADATLSLKTFAEQSGQEIVYPVDVVSGTRTNAVRGEFAPTYALDRMLAGTGLVATQSSNGLLSVNRVKSPNGQRAAQLTRSDRPPENRASVESPAGVGAISGLVTGSIADAPLAGALVTLVGIDKVATTNSEGRFQIGALTAGTHTLRVSYLGFEPKDVSVEIVAQRTTPIEIQLGTETITLSRFVVEGQRGGQARALNEQRTSENLKNILASDEFGRFPDQNAAEALQRIVGVSLVRDEGEGQTIRVRGIEENLNHTSLNGVSIPGTRGGREVLLDSIPSDLLDTIEVTKVFTPDMEGQGIGGAINLKTLTAFSREGRIARISAEGQYNDGSERWGKKFSATIGEKFGGNKWGLLASGSYSDRYLHTSGLSVASWTTKNNFLIPGGAVNLDEVDARRTRDGFNMSLDFRPDDQNSFYARGVFTRFRQRRLRVRTTFQNNAASTTPTSDRTGTVTGRPVVINLQSLSEESKTWSTTVGGEHQWPVMKLDYAASYSRGQLYLEPVPAPFNSGNTSWTYDLTDHERPKFTGAGLAQQPAAYNATTYKWEHGFKHEIEITAEANLRREAEIAGHRGYVKAGAKYREKRKVNDDNQETWNVNGVTLASITDYTRAEGSSFATVNPRDYSINARFDTYFHENPARFTYDTDVSGRDNILGDFVDHEDVAAGYAMAGVNIGKLGLVGGVRVEHTMFESRGWKTIGNNLATLERIKASKDYTGVMPSIVGRYRFSPRLQGRFSWTGTQSRPKFSNSAYSVTINENTGVWSQGNPNLDPYRASNWDASFEFYPRSLGIISAGIFHKDIKDFIATETIVGGAPDGRDVRMPVNADAARVTGVELEWQQHFRMLPSPLDGLGVYANLTVTDSEANYTNLAIPRTEIFTNTSKRMSNLALTYEKYGAFVRVSANYRSEYLATVNVDPNNDQFVPSQWRLDVSASYRLTPRLTWYAEGINLNDTPNITQIRETRGVLTAQYYSWSANTGLRVRF